MLTAVRHIVTIRTLRDVSSGVEQLPFKQMVAGSNPARPTIFVQLVSRRRSLEFEDMVYYEYVAIYFEFL